MVPTLTPATRWPQYKNRLEDTNRSHTTGSLSVFLYQQVYDSLSSLYSMSLNRSRPFFSFYNNTASTLSLLIMETFCLSRTLFSNKHGRGMCEELSKCLLKKLCSLSRLSCTEGVCQSTSMLSWTHGMPSAIHRQCSTSYERRITWCQESDDTCNLLCISWSTQSMSFLWSF